MGGGVERNLKYRTNGKQICEKIDFISRPQKLRLTFEFRIYTQFLREGIPNRFEKLMIETTKSVVQMCNIIMWVAQQCSVL